MRDRIIVGLGDEETRHKLLAEPKLQLSDAVRIARAEEAARVTKRNMTNVSVNATRQKSAYAKSKKPFVPKGNDKCQDSSELKSSRVPDGKCGRCGKSHTLNGQCPANDQDCRKCGRKGHFAKLCWSKDNTSKRNFKAGRIRTRACQTKPDIRLPVMTEVQSGTTTIVWKDDTGSDVDVTGPKHMESLRLTTDMLSPITETVTAADASSRLHSCITTVTD